MYKLGSLVEYKDGTNNSYIKGRIVAIVHITPNEYDYYIEGSKKSYLYTPFSCYKNYKSCFPEDLVGTYIYFNESQYNLYKVKTFNFISSSSIKRVISDKTGIMIDLYNQYEEQESEIVEAIILPIPDVYYM